MAMFIIIFVLLVAVVNLAVGFGLAVYLGQRHRQAAAGIEVGSTSPRAASAGGAPAATSVPAGIPPWSHAADSGSASVPPWAPTGTAAAESAVEAPPEPPADEAAAGLPDADAAAEEKRPEAPAAENGIPAGEPAASEAVLRRLWENVAGYHDRLGKIDGEIRARARNGDARGMESALQAFRGITEAYLEERQTAWSRFAELHGDREDLGDLNRQLDAALEEEGARVTQAGRVAGGTQPTGDLEGRCQRMIAETSRLASAGRRVRDAIEGISARVACHDRWLDQATEVLREDRLTGLPARLGFEAELARWWRHDPHRTQPLAVVLVEVDHYARIDEQDGMEAGSGVLQVLARILREEVREAGNVARCASCRFAILLPGKLVREAVELAERIRQVVESTHFQSSEEEIQVTTSCGITAAGTEDTSDSFLARAELALREAKGSGGNRTYCHEGKYPSPVVPINLPKEDSFVAIGGTGPS